MIKAKVFSEISDPPTRVRYWVYRIIDTDRPAGMQNVESGVRPTWSYAMSAACLKLRIVYTEDR